MASVGHLTIHVDTTAFDEAMVRLRAALGERAPKPAIVQAGWFARPMLLPVQGRRVRQRPMAWMVVDDNGHWRAVK